MINLTLAITTFNRMEMTLESFSKVVNHPRIDEILILDDGSPQNVVDAIAEATKDVPKIVVMKQAQNRGMMQNKADAVALAKNEWVILFDSDNVLFEQYVNSIPQFLDPSVIYVPAFAEPNFDMTRLAGKLIDARTYQLYVGLECFAWFLNVCNYVVNRDRYAKIYEFNNAIKGTDTAYFAYNWLTSGGRFYVMPGAHYKHRVHDGSEFMKDVNYNMQKAEEILQKIKTI